MMDLVETIRRISACYQALSEQSTTQPRFRDRFASLAARYGAIAVRQEAAEKETKG